MRQKKRVFRTSFLFFGMLTIGLSILANDGTCLERAQSLRRPRVSFSQCDVLRLRLSESATQIFSQMNKDAQRVVDTFSPDEGERILMGDIHGNYSAMILPILMSGLAKIDKNKPFILYNTRTGEDFDISQCDEIEKTGKLNVSSYVVLPNLRKTARSDWKHSLFFSGDYLDRGEYSLEVLYTLDRLTKQFQGEEENPLTVILGNHETDHLRPRKRSKFTDPIANMIEEGRAVFISEVDGKIVSHSYLTERFLSFLKDQDLTEDEILLVNKFLRHPTELVRGDGHRLNQIVTKTLLLKREDFMKALLGREEGSFLWARPQIREDIPIQGVTMFHGHNITTEGSQVESLGDKFKRVYFLDMENGRRGPTLHLLKGESLRSLSIGPFEQMRFANPPDRKEMSIFIRNHQSSVSGF